MDIAVAGLAKDHLSLARRKMDALRHVTCLDDAAILWSEFLTNMVRSFNKLGNAMDSGAEQGWHQRQKKMLKADAVMRYLWQARHADEHGRVVITYRSSAIAIGLVQHVPGSVAIAPGVTFIPNLVRPAIVTNFGVEYVPPVTGALISFAQEGLRYMDGVFVEAAAKFG